MTSWTRSPLFFLVLFIVHYGHGRIPDIIIDTRACPDIACDPASCPNGFETNSYGCITCQCKPECPIIRCPMDLRCPFGFQKGPDGCQTSCKCSSKPDDIFGRVCPEITCHPESCPGGFEIDSNGCNTCRCKPSLPVECPVIRCPMDLRCPFGFQKGPGGCQTSCRCSSDDILGQVCPDIACDPASCPNGFEFDSNGCNTCQCKTSLRTNCPVVRCPMELWCPFGYEKGPDDCQRSCRCQSQP